MAVAKLSAIFGTGRPEKPVFAYVDRSPHCAKTHYNMHEIERMLPKHIPVENCVVSEGKIVRVPDGVIEMSKSLAELTRIIRDGA